MLYEELKDIPGYEGLYAITRNGDIWSYPKTGSSGHGGQWIKRVITQGYEKVTLCLPRKSKRKKGFFVHRLVGITYLQNIENKPTINHKNGVKIDNRVENLEWATLKEQSDHAHFVLGQEYKNRNFMMQMNKKSIARTMKKVIKYSLSGDFIHEYPSVMDAHRATGINRHTIGDTCLGRKHTSGGFIWKYA